MNAPRERRPASTKKPIIQLVDCQGRGAQASFWQTNGEPGNGERGTGNGVPTRWPGGKYKRCVQPSATTAPRSSASVGIGERGHRRAWASASVGIGKSVSRVAADRERALAERPVPRSLFPVPRSRFSSVDSIEQRGADADHGGAFGDCQLEIAAHPHRQFRGIDVPAALPMIA